MVLVTVQIETPGRDKDKRKYKFDPSVAGVKLYFLIFIMLSADYKFILLERRLQWIMFENKSSSRHDTTWIRLYGCFFSYFDIEFKLCGFMSLVRCQFKSEYHFIRLSLEKILYEPEITRKTLTTSISTSLKIE